MMKKIPIRHNIKSLRSERANSVVIDMYPQEVRGSNPSTPNVDELKKKFKDLLDKVHRPIKHNIESLKTLFKI